MRSWDIAVGSNVFIGSGSWLQVLDSLSGGSIRIGDGASLAGMDVLSAAQEIVLEQDVLLARNVYIADHSHAFEDKSLPIRLQGITKIAPVRIGRGAWLGQNVVICPGTTIGRGAVVGANSVVNRDVPDFSVAVGAPARVIRTVE
ncbi:MAG: acyltransferase [Acidobacteriota bacterium]